VKSSVITVRLHTNFRPGSSQTTFGKAARSREKFAVVRRKGKEMSEPVVRKKQKRIEGTEELMQNHKVYQEPTNCT
jgi:hypothetical protein